LLFSDIALANAALQHATPLKATLADDRVQELNDYITALESDQTDTRVLQKLALLCSSNPIPSASASPLSPGLGLPHSVSPFLGTNRSLPPLIPDIWTKDKSFERLFNALITFLQPSRVCQLFLIQMIETHSAYLLNRMLNSLNMA